jgi:hypothetical protein
VFGPAAPSSDMLAEAKLLRQHKGRLEARMQILEDHNRQLEAQLQRLRQLLDEVYSFLYRCCNFERQRINLIFLYFVSYAACPLCHSWQGVLVC